MNQVEQKNFRAGLQRYFKAIVKARHPYICFMCNEQSDTYMVDDELWEKAFPNYHFARSLISPRNRSRHIPGPGQIFLLLCFSCLEDRIGRKLKLSDFTEAKINDPIRFGFQMGKRTRCPSGANEI